MQEQDPSVPTEDQRAQRPESLSTQRAHENFEKLRDDESVAVDERVPSQPLNPTVTRDQPVTEPARFGGHRIGTDPQPEHGKDEPGASDQGHRIG